MARLVNHKYTCNTTTNNNYPSIIKSSFNVLIVSLALFFFYIYPCVVYPYDSYSLDKGVGVINTFSSFKREPKRFAISLNSGLLSFYSSSEEIIGIMNSIQFGYSPLENLSIFATSYIDIGRFLGKTEGVVTTFKRFTEFSVGAFYSKTFKKLNFSILPSLFIPSNPAGAPHLKSASFSPALGISTNIWRADLNLNLGYNFGFSNQSQDSVLATFTRTSQNYLSIGFSSVFKTEWGFSPFIESSAKIKNSPEALHIVGTDVEVLKEVILKVAGGSFFPGKIPFAIFVGTTLFPAELFKREEKVVIARVMEREVLTTEEVGLSKKEKEKEPEKQIQIPEPDLPMDVSKIKTEISKMREMVKKTSPVEDKIIMYLSKGKILATAPLFEIRQEKDKIVADGRVEYYFSGETMKYEIIFDKDTLKPTRIVFSSGRKGVKTIMGEEKGHQFYCSFSHDGNITEVGFSVNNPEEIEGIISKFSRGDFKFLRPWEISIKPFEFGKADLTEELEKQVEEIAKYFMIYKRLRVVLIGGADVKGDDKLNLQLGILRANSVKEYLLKKGVEEDRITISSVGKIILEPYEFARRVNVVTILSALSAEE